MFSYPVDRLGLGRVLNFLHHAFINLFNKNSVGLYARCHVNPEQTKTQELLPVLKLYNEC